MIFITEYLKTIFPTTAVKYCTWLSSVCMYEQVPLLFAIPCSIPWGSTPLWKGVSWPIASFAGVRYRLEISKQGVSWYFSCEVVQLSKMPSENWWSKCLYISTAASNALVKVADPRPVNTMHCWRYLKCCADILLTVIASLDPIWWCLWLTLAFLGLGATPLLSGFPVLWRWLLPLWLHSLLECLSNAMNLGFPFFWLQTCCRMCRHPA